MDCDGELRRKVVKPDPDEQEAPWESRLRMTENKLLWCQSGAMRMSRNLQSFTLLRTSGTSLNGGNAYANRFSPSRNIASTAQAL